MAEAEGPREGGLNTPIQGWVGALQAPAPVTTGIRCTLIFIHFTPLSAEAWSTHEGIRKQVIRQLPSMTQASPGQDGATSSGCGC